MSMIGNLRAVDDSTIDKLLADPASIQTFLYEAEEEDEGSFTDLDKAWHTIHYILTDSAWGGDFPLGFLVSAGVAIGDEDVGYGPARAFRSTQVREIHKALDAVSDDEFRRRFSVDKMKNAEIYPSFGHASDEEEIPYFLDYYNVVKEFISKADSEEKGLIVYIN